MGKSCNKVRKITYPRTELDTSIQRIDNRTFLVVETVIGRDADNNEYQIIFSGSAKQLTNSELFISNTQVVITRDNKSVNLTVQDLVTEGYRTQLGKYKDLNNGNKFIVVDANTAYFCMHF